MTRRCKSCSREDGLVVYRGVKGKDLGTYMLGDGAVYDAKTHELLDRRDCHSFFGRETRVKVLSNGLCRSCQNRNSARVRGKQLDMIDWIDGRAA